MFEEKILLFFKDEGEYVCPRCTIFGLDKEELAKLMHLGIKFTDLNKEEDGYEAHTSIFKVCIIFIYIFRDGSDYRVTRISRKMRLRQVG